MKAKTLVLTDRQEAQSVFFSGLKNEYTLEFFDSAKEALERLRNQHFEFLFVDINFLETYADRSAPNPYVSSLKTFRAAFPSTKIITLAEGNGTRRAVQAVKAGAEDYLNYPIDKSELELITSSIRETRRRALELDYLRDQFWSDDVKGIVTSANTKVRGVFELIKSVAPTRSTVLLTGETGVGKSMMAKVIHDHSERRKGPFIPVHCGAISESLVESELFGHEKGAFTGAISRKLGKFELSNGGTIFLDEIGTISSQVQIKLLQVLQDSTFQRVGGETDIKIDVRIIAATNEDLKSMVEQKQFRRDLFHRISVFPVEIPPLRERTEDIPRILEGLLERLNAQSTKHIRGALPEVTLALSGYDWLGNIRELENVVERAYILESSDMLTPESFPTEIMGDSENLAIVPLDSKKTLAEAREEVIENFERQYLKELLAEKRGRINETAEAAGVGTRQIHKLMSKYGLSKEEFKNNENP